jgi:hypothetical protein
MSDLSEALDAVAEAARLASVIPGTAGTLSRIASTVFSSAAALARAGKDPAVEIERIHAADPLVQSVKDEWQRAMDEKFGRE